MQYKYTHPKNILVQGILTYDTKLEEGQPLQSTKRHGGSGYASRLDS
jgi:hypothetical protein